MSLPQRKKSAEEIAKLRESLGIPGQPPDEGPPPAEVTPPGAEVAPEDAEVVAREIPAKEEAPAGKDESAAKDEPAAKEEAVVSPSPSKSKAEPAPVAKPAPALEPLPVSDPPAPRAVRSLKRSERIPVLSVENEPAEPAAPREEPSLPGKTVLPTMQTARTVRSLKKSEQGPVEHHEPAADSKLPQYRHSDKELGEIRRREAIAAVNTQEPPKPMVAHLSMVIPGYLAAIGGGVGFHYYDLAIQVTAVCVGIALLVAAFIFIKRPLSRHHAAFIAVMTLFVIVFGALHYFPQLQHGT
ncbi:MAG: hypothetical protein EOP88_28420 [Verrucomicrobiaceae bacterium]|nr:MAG: hypothetical protein EOP88_28420 [Verrucomicrobiaceae bacterium]